MVGGKVVGVARKGGVTLLNVEDRRHGDGCAVRCVERRADTGEPVAVAVGDGVWWQCRRVYWTPAGVDAAATPQFTAGVANWDVPLPKVGYSH